MGGSLNCPSSETTFENSRNILPGFVIMPIRQGPGIY
jgi:hypothetical protein